MDAIRSVLLQMDATPHSLARLRHARDLARHCDAALSAMYVALPPSPPLTVVLSESPAALFVNSDWSAHDAAQELFVQECADLPNAHWISPAETAVDNPFMHHAAYADLVILGARHPASPKAAAPGFVESTVLGSGRPALILPRDWAWQGPPRTIVLGWDASPHAVHALAAGMPWLRLASSVHVLDGSQARHGTAEGLNIEHHLRQHGIQAEVHRHVAAQDAGDALMSLADDRRADLVVMGCYGHSRTRELMLGGATRHMLAHAWMPLLMTH
jgi:nucleotide-binding universal stress UspA family protein